MRTILVADDEADNRTIISLALTASGYRVCQARDGKEAFDVAMREVPDLILLDLSMPIVSGWDAARRLKAEPLTLGIPVYAFTANALAGDEAKARAVGCDGFISKPCIPKDVVEAIHARVGR